MYKRHKHNFIINKCVLTSSYVKTPKLSTLLFKNKKKPNFNVQMSFLLCLNVNKHNFLCPVE